MLKQIVQSSAAPQAIGPYSQAVCSGGLVYCSGQLPIDVATGKIPDEVAEQTRAVLSNLSEVLKSAGSRTCRFPASGFPAGFTARHATGPLENDRVHDRFERLRSHEPRV